MKTTLFTFLFFIPFFLFSQQWCPAGATWYYDYSAFNASGTTQIKYIKDTTINSTSYKILKDSTITISGPLPISLNTFISYLYTRMSNDSIYFLYNGGDHFAYRFNPSLTDTFTNNIVHCSDSIATCSISNIDSITFNGYKFQTQHIHTYVPNTSPFIGNDSFIVAERIGPINVGYLFPFVTLCTEDHYYQFRCYSDDSIQTSLDTTCNDFPNSIDNRIAASINHSIFPNPVIDELNIQMNSSVINIQNLQLNIFNIFGVKQAISHDYNLQNFDLNQVIRIPTNDLTSGMYYFTISDLLSKILKTSKFIKE